MSAWALYSLWRPRKQTRISLKSAKFEGERVRCTWQPCRAPCAASAVQKVVMNLVIRASLLTELGSWRLDSSRRVSGDSRCHGCGSARALGHRLAISDVRCCPGQQPPVGMPGFSPVNRAEIQRAECLCLLVLPLLFLELFIILVSFLFLGGFHNLR